MSEPNEDEIVLASAARYLIDGKEEDAASVLLSCSLQFWPSGDFSFVGDETHEALHVKLVGPRAAYDILTDKNQPITQAIQNSIAAVLPENTYIRHFTVHVQHVSIDANWREELLDAYSDPNRPPIPTQIGHLFRSKPATVTEQIGHPWGGVN
ncbi:MAG TPA: hypothetical protein VMR20_04615 [Verrucomicrobiae bacterium]|nr:hypothetical protein [Verrucomicrobiae bacterium]